MSQFASAFQSQPLVEDTYLSERVFNNIALTKRQYDSVAPTYVNGKLEFVNREAEVRQLQQMTNGASPPESSASFPTLLSQHASFIPPAYATSGSVQDYLPYTPYEIVYDRKVLATESPEMGRIFQTDEYTEGRKKDAVRLNRLHLNSIAHQIAAFNSGTF